MARLLELYGARYPNPILAPSASQLARARHRPCLANQTSVTHLPSSKALCCENSVICASLTVELSRYKVGIHIFLYQGNNIWEVCEQDVGAQKAESHASKTWASSQFYGTLSLYPRPCEVPLPGILTINPKKPSASITDRRTPENYDDLYTTSGIVI